MLARATLNSGTQVIYVAGNQFVSAVGITVTFVKSEGAMKTTVDREVRPSSPAPESNMSIPARSRSLRRLIKCYE